MPATRLWVGCLAWVIAASALPGADGQGPTSPFDACQPSAREWTYDDLLCLFRIGSERRQLGEARSRLRQLGAGDPAQPWATLVLGHATLNDDEVEAIRHYERAAEDFGRVGEAEGEVVARQNLRFLYRRRGDADAAAAQVTRALAAAETSKRPLTVARASILEAAHLMETGGDIGRAHRALRRAESLAFPDAPIGLRRSILFNLANANLFLGRLDEAIDALERHRVLRKEDGSTADAAAVAFNLLNARVTQAETRPVASARERLAAMADEVVAETVTLGRPAIEAQAHRLLGELLRPSDPDRAARHLRRCLEIEATLGYPDVRAACLWSLSLHEAARDPARADALSRDAIALVTANRTNTLLAYAWQSRLRLAWQRLPADQAMADSIEALDAVERLRANQRDAGSRAALFGNWTRDYHWLTGRLLDQDPPHTARAFDIGERLRGRVLLEHLARAGVPRMTEPQPSIEPVGARIAATQRRLLSSSLTPGERRVLTDQLALLELERNEAASLDAPPIDPQTMRFATIDAVQQALEPHEAMIWFSIAPWKDLYEEFGGGAWALVLTRHEVSVHRLPTRVELDSQVAALIGLVERRETASALWETAARRLGETLFGAPIAALPASVTRLIVAADGVVHRVPIDLLRPDDDPRALGARYEMVSTPSATLWLRLRTARTTRPEHMLIFADPDVARGSPDGAERLEPLPWARREGAAIARLTPATGSRLLLGAEATERRLKDAALDTSGVLHLAAHARADDAFPERSAVFLAAGEDGEDGWLQPPEIAALDLRGLLVVLSACESADGALLSGEGPLSLARAFFAGGAHAVVATRWPLRDDDGAYLMDRFYRGLATGATASAALHQARLDAMASGRPASVWAGVVLLGDGAYPVLGPAERSTPWWWMGLAAVAIAAAMVWGWRRRGR